MSISEIIYNMKVESLSFFPVSIFQLNPLSYEHSPKNKQTENSAFSLTWCLVTAITSAAQLHFHAGTTVPDNATLVVLKFLGLRTPCSLPGFSVHGILQARILESVATPSPGDLPDPGIKPGYPALQADSLPSELPGRPCFLNGFYWLLIFPWN